MGPSCFRDPPQPGLRWSWGPQITGMGQGPSWVVGIVGKRAEGWLGCVFIPSASHILPHLCREGEPCRVRGFPVLTHGCQCRGRAGTMGCRVSEEGGGLGFILWAKATSLEQRWPMSQRQAYNS
jgi:hypothetical protein